MSNVATSPSQTVYPKVVVIAETALPEEACTKVHAFARTVIATIGRLLTAARVRVARVSDGWVCIAVLALSTGSLFARRIVSHDLEEAVRLALFRATEDARAALGGAVGEVHP